jgi:hypothetical protein
MWIMHEARHPERSEGSPPHRKILRCAQNDNDLRRLMHNPLDAPGIAIGLTICDHLVLTHLESTGFFVAEVARLQTD